MTGFLKQCLDRSVELAGGKVQFKKVSTPFQDDRIARPTKDDTEKKGILQPRLQNPHEGPVCCADGPF